MIKKWFYKLRWIVPSIINKSTFKIRRIDVGTNVKVLGRMFIRGKGKIKIGNDVTINSCLEANPIGGSTRTIFFIKDGAELKIGDSVGISNSAFYSEKNIVIEDNVFIGNNCKVYDSNFHSVDYQERSSHHESVVSKPVLIKQGAFVGAHSIILKGVTIGKHSIIGAGSVVTKSVPDGEVWGGNPARFIKKSEK